MAFQARDVSAGGAQMTGGGTRLLGGGSLKAGVDAASAVVRETDGSGRILAVLAAPAGTTDHWTPAGPVAFNAGLHVTTTGTTPIVILLEA